MSCSDHNSSQRVLFLLTSGARNRAPRASAQRNCAQRGSVFGEDVCSEIVRGDEVCPGGSVLGGMVLVCTERSTLPWGYFIAEHTSILRTDVEMSICYPRTTPISLHSHI
jgi:hypothetical protein